MKLTHGQIQSFQEKVWQFFNDHKRSMPWRETADPYNIMVSEIMLQQTQVPRVIAKYEEFLNKFPNVEVLANASLGEVLKVWSGLGYNRRAKYLHQAAQQIIKQPTFPNNVEDLTELPGIGPNTAGAIMAYAYDQPALFVETNIRTVYIHEFFDDREGVTDKEIKELLEQTIDAEHPREWYWALMDYGSYLKKEAGNASKRSKHYAKQSKFQGSKRQVRGRILKLLITQPYNKKQLQELVADERLAVVLDDLVREGLVMHKHKLYMLG